MKRLDLLVVESMNAPGHLSLRYIDMLGRQHSLQSSLDRAGFVAGQRVTLFEADEITAEGIEIEIDTEGEK